jgi:DNA-binding beta-propeller fold protein YncE
MWAGAGDQADYRSPSALCVDPEGITLYVAQTTDRTVAVFDLESGRVEKSIAVPGTPGDLALSPDASRLYIALAEPDGQVAVVNPTAMKTMSLSLLRVRLLRTASRSNVIIPRLRWNAGFVS